MSGPLLNAAAIVLGAILGVALRRALTPRLQQFLKVALGVFAVWIGLKLLWGAWLGGWAHFGRLVVITMAALTLGRITGRLLRVQRGLNHLGWTARDRLQVPASGPRLNDGLTAAMLLFCATPLAVLASVQDGLHHNVQPFILKGMLDGLATMSFAATFGVAVGLAALPVTAYQVTLTRGLEWLEPVLRQHGLLDAVDAVCGLLIFTGAMLILEIKRLEWGDYLPALIYAPLLAWVWS